MRILIADDSVANSKALRSVFAPAAGRKRFALKSSGKRSPAAGQLMISCAPKGRRKNDECACSGLDLGDQPEHAATILDSLGIALLNRGCLDEGSALIALALSIRRKFFGPDHPATAASQNSTSRVLRERGDYDDAEAAAQDALRINRRVFGDQGLPVAISLNELGVVQLLQGRFQDAEHSAIQGLGILKTLGLEATDPNTTRLMDVRGRAELNLGKIEAATATYQALLALDLKQLGTKKHPKYATHLANFGLVKEAQKKLDSAAKDYRNAIDLYFHSLSRPCHPNLIDAYANLGSLLRVRNRGGDLSEAGELFDKALRLDERIRGDSHVFVGNDYANMGRFHYDSGNARLAQSGFSKALRIYAKNVRRGRLPAEHFYIAEALTWKGRILVESDSAAYAGVAEPLLEEAIRIWPVQLGLDTVGEAIAEACLGRALFLQNKAPARARELLEGAYPIVLAEVGKDSELVRRIEKWIKDLGASGKAVRGSASAA